MKFKVTIGILIAILSLIAISSSMLLYKSVQEENRLKAVITGYQTKVAAVEERNMRVVSYANHLLMTVGSLQQEGN